MTLRLRIHGIVLCAVALLVLPPSTLAVEHSGRDIKDPEVITFSKTEDPMSGVITARLSRGEVEAIVQFDKHTSALLGSKPTARLHLNYRPAFRSWSIHIREIGSSLDLERLIVDDRTGAIKSRWFASTGTTIHRLAEFDARNAADASNECVQTRKKTLGKRKSGEVAHFVAEDQIWEIDTVHKGKTYVRCEVDDTSGNIRGVWTGPQIEWKMARGVYHAFGADINNWYVWWPLFIVFAALFLQPLALRSWNTVDVVALLGIGVSHEFFNHGNIDWSVPLAYPPLVYLFVRMSIWFVRGVRSAEPARAAVWLATWPPTRLCWGLAVLFAGIRYGVNGWGSNVIDVGYAGTLGGDAILHHRLPYGHMPSDNQHGDTYGPLNYLLYVPAVWLFPNIDPSAGQGLVSAHAVSIASDLLCAGALTWIGWRWISQRAGALLLCGWMVYPYTAFALCNNVNDLLVAAMLLIAFALMPVAWLRGLFIGAAAGIKFVPLIALPVILHGGGSKRLRQSLWTIVGALVALGACLLFVLSYKHGWKSFRHATFGFQFDRSSPFSIWGLYDLRWLQRIAQAALALAVLVAIFIPQRRDFRQIAAGIGAAVIGSQLVLQHWFYAYIPWYFGFVLIVMVARREVTALDHAQVQRELASDASRPNLYTQES